MTAATIAEAERELLASRAAHTGLIMATGCDAERWSGGRRPAARVLGLEGDNSATANEGRREKKKHVELARMGRASLA